jgi:regulatory protein
MAFFRKKKLEAKPTPDEAMIKLESFCSFRDRCTQEVKQRMRELEITGDDVDMMLEVLETDGFLDDKRFAKQYAWGKFRNQHWGKVRIRQELSMRALPKNLIELAFMEIPDEQYLATLDEMLVKKQSDFDDTRDGKSKLANFAIRKGFEPGLVFAALKTLKPIDFNEN